MNISDKLKNAMVVLDGFPKPKLISPIENSYNRSESRKFNSIDWNKAGSKEYFENIEGAICLQAEGFLHLIPNLLRMAYEETCDERKVSDMFGEVIRFLSRKSFHKPLLEAMTEVQIRTLFEFLSDIAITFNYDVRSKNELFELRRMYIENLKS